MGIGRVIPRRKPKQTSHPPGRQGQHPGPNHLQDCPESDTRLLQGPTRYGVIPGAGQESYLLQGSISDLTLEEIKAVVWRIESTEKHTRGAED